ncbi:MAG: DUF2064 domain-containing protein [Dokdonella sp.]
MKRCGLGIFVKTPALSPVKTRLWPAIGQQQATQMFEHSADATHSVVARAMSRCSMQAYWAVAEATIVHEERWTGLPTIAQGAGGLGERMAQVYNQLRRDHQAAILIGADSPQLSTSAVEAATTWLGGSEPRLVIGPAEDGGFWLFGGNVELPSAAWTQAEYSNADTCNVFRSAMDQYGNWLTLASLRDLDRVDDIQPVASALACVADPTEQQLSLLAFLEQLQIHIEAST